ncbi:hypothetical protein R6Q59_012284 [Mikania micrantha]
MRNKMVREVWSWIFISQSNPWKYALSWLIFFIFTIAVPILSHIVYQCSACDDNHRRPFDLIVQLSLSLCSTLSFINLSSFARKYGLRRFLFLDKLTDVSVRVRDGCSDQLHRSMKLLCTFIIPCFLADSFYKIWWFSSGGNQIPYITSNIHIGHTIACSLLLCSWLYRTSLFFLRFRSLTRFNKHSEKEGSRLLQGTLRFVIMLATYIFPMNVLFFFFRFFFLIFHKDGFASFAQALFHMKGYLDYSLCHQSWLIMMQIVSSSMLLFLSYDIRRSAMIPATLP